MKSLSKLSREIKTDHAVLRGVIIGLGLRFDRVGVSIVVDGQAEQKIRAAISHDLETNGASINAKRKTTVENN